MRRKTGRGGIFGVPQTRLDMMLLIENRDQGVMDLRPGEGVSCLVRENRDLTIGRVRRLERYGLARAIEPGRWTLTVDAAGPPRDLAQRYHQDQVQRFSVGIDSSND
jgi:hypothetical protein